MRVGVRMGRNRLDAVAVSDVAAPVARSVESDGADPEHMGSAFDELLRGLLRETVGLPGRKTGSGVSIASITCDISALLEPIADPGVVLIRIAPRAPMGPVDELRGPVEEFGPARIVHIAGGHSSFGEELVPLDTEALKRFAAEAPRGARYVVTSVGSYVNTDHEIVAGRILSASAAPRSVDYSQSFYSSSFGTRERTALVNSAVVPRAEALATVLGLVSGRFAPSARLYVTTNDGGCVPLARLSVTPVHSMYATRASRLVGAAALHRLMTGRVLVVTDREAFLGEMIDGAAVVGPEFRDQSGARLATKAANSVPFSRSMLEHDPAYPIVLSAEAATGEFGHRPHQRAESDLGALGAAYSPLVDWVNRVVIVRTEEQLRQELAAAEARVRTRLVSFGAAPSAVRILESRGEAATFNHRSVVAVRVRGIAERAAADPRGWAGAG